jgi:hypothetical protein
MNMKRLLVSLGILLSVAFGAVGATPAFATTPTDCAATTGQTYWAGNGNFYYCDPATISNQYELIAGATVQTTFQSNALTTLGAKFYVYKNLAAYQLDFPNDGGTEKATDYGWTLYSIPRSVIVENTTTATLLVPSQIENAHHEVGHLLDYVWGGYTAHLSSQSAYEATVATDWAGINAQSACQGLLSTADKDAVCGTGTTPTGAYTGLTNEQILQKLYPHWLTDADSPLWWDLFAQEYAYNWNQNEFPIDGYMKYFHCSVKFVQNYQAFDAAPSGTCTY